VASGACLNDCGTSLALLREDALFCSEACSKAWRRAHPRSDARKVAERRRSADKDRTGTRKPTRYRVFEVFFAGQQLRPVGEVEANKKAQAIAMCSNGGENYIAVPVSALKVFDAEGRPTPPAG
jgi:hypothetical protein